MLLQSKTIRLGENTNSENVKNFQFGDIEMTNNLKLARQTYFKHLRLLRNINLASLVSLIPVANSENDHLGDGVAYENDVSKSNSIASDNSKPNIEISGIIDKTNLLLNLAGDYFIRLPLINCDYTKQQGSTSVVYGSCLVGWHDSSLIELYKLEDVAQTSSLINLEHEDAAVDLGGCSLSAEDNASYIAWPVQQIDWQTIKSAYLMSSSLISICAILVNILLLLIMILNGKKKRHSMFRNNNLSRNNFLLSQSALTGLILAISILISSLVIHHHNSNQEHEDNDTMKLDSSLSQLPWFSVSPMTTAIWTQSRVDANRYPAKLTGLGSMVVPELLLTTNDVNQADVSCQQQKVHLTYYDSEALEGNFSRRSAPSDPSELMKASIFISANCHESLMAEAKRLDTETLQDGHGQRSVSMPIWSLLSLLTNVLTAIHLWTVAALAYDRYCAIVHPFQYLRSLYTTRLRAFFLLAWLFSTLLNLWVPMMRMYGGSNNKHVGSNITTASANMIQATPQSIKKLFGKPAVNHSDPSTDGPKWFDEANILGSLMDTSSSGSNWHIVGQLAISLSSFLLNLLVPIVIIAICNLKVYKIVKGHERRQSVNSANTTVSAAIYNQQQQLPKSRLQLLVTSLQEHLAGEKLHDESNKANKNTRGSTNGQRPSDQRPASSCLPLGYSDSSYWWQRNNSFSSSSSSSSPCRFSSSSSSSSSSSGPSTSRTAATQAGAAILQAGTTIGEESPMLTRETNYLVRPLASYCNQQQAVGSPYASLRGIKRKNSDAPSACTNNSSQQRKCSFVSATSASNYRWFDTGGVEDDRSQSDARLAGAESVKAGLLKQLKLAGLSFAGIAIQGQPSIERFNSFSSMTNLRPSQHNFAPTSGRRRSSPRCSFDSWPVSPVSGQQARPTTLIVSTQDQTYELDTKRNDDKKHNNISNSSSSIANHQMRQQQLAPSDDEATDLGASRTASQRSQRHSFFISLGTKSIVFNLVLWLVITLSVLVCCEYALAVWRFSLKLASDPRRQPADNCKRHWVSLYASLLSHLCQLSFTFLVTLNGWLYGIRSRSVSSTIRSVLKRYISKRQASIEISLRQKSLTSLGRSAREPSLLVNFPLIYYDINNGFCTSTSGVVGGKQRGCYGGANSPLIAPGVKLMRRCSSFNGFKRDIHASSGNCNAGPLQTMCQHHLHQQQQQPLEHNNNNNNNNQHHHHHETTTSGSNDGDGGGSAWQLGQLGANNNKGKPRPVTRAISSEGYANQQLQSTQSLAANADSLATTTADWTGASCFLGTRQRLAPSKGSTQSSSASSVGTTRNRINFMVTSADQKHHIIDLDQLGTSNPSELVGAPSLDVEANQCPESNPGLGFEGWKKKLAGLFPTRKFAASLRTKQRSGDIKLARELQTTKKLKSATRFRKSISVASPTKVSRRHDEHESPGASKHQATRSSSRKKPDQTKQISQQQQQQRENRPSTKTSLVHRRCELGSELLRQPSLLQIIGIFEKQTAANGANGSQLLNTSNHGNCCSALSPIRECPSSHSCSSSIASMALNHSRASQATLSQTNRFDVDQQQQQQQAPTA